MISLRWFGFCAASACLSVVSFGACSSEDAAGEASEDGGASSSGSSSGTSSSSSSGGSRRGASSSSSSGGTSSSSGSSGTSSSSSSSSSGDSGPDSSADGGSFCGAPDFRKPGAVFSPVDPDGLGWLGGVLSAGTYDAVKVESGLSNGGSIRETLTLDGAGHFARIRQIRTSADGGVGKVAQRSGTVSVEGSTITFDGDCTFLDGEDNGPEVQTAQYTVYVDDAGHPAIRYGASGLIITLRQDP